MSYAKRELSVVAILVIAAWLLQRITTVHLTSFIPGVLLLSLVFVWALPRRPLYLISLIVVTELFTAQLPGIMTLTVLFALLIYKIRGRAALDLSSRFFALLTVTVTGQLIVQLMPGLILAARATDLSPFREAVPWQSLTPIIISTTVAAFILSLAVQYVLPDEQRDVVSLESRRLSFRRSR